MVVWSAISLQEAIIAFENTDGELYDRMKVALHAAATAQGLNGRKKRTYKKERMSVNMMAKDEQLATYRKIVREELESYDLTWDQLIHGGQMRPVVDCRWMIIWRVRGETKMSYPALGQLLEVDHTTCVNAYSCMEETQGRYYLDKPCTERKLKENRAKLEELDKRLAA